MVKYVFADTAYFLAPSSRRDQLHLQARVLRARHRKGLLTTEWVLTEVAAAPKAWPEATLGSGRLRLEFDRYPLDLPGERESQFVGKVHR